MRLLTGAFIIKICENDNRNHFGVNLFRLGELLMKLAEFWVIIGRGPPKNFGTSRFIRFLKFRRKSCFSLIAWLKINPKLYILKLLCKNFTEYTEKYFKLPYINLRL